MTTIKALRTRAGLTQEKLAALVGVNQTAISQWETERCSPSVPTLVKLAAALHCTVDDLIRKD